MRYLSACALALTLAFAFVGPAGANTLAHTFDEFPAEVIPSPHPVDPILKRGTPEYDYRTRIRGAAEEGEIAFAGHYIIAEWGCGTQCQWGAIIDALTGKVYMLPVASGGWEYYPDSNLLVVNPDDEEDPPHWLIREYHVWDEQEKKLNLEFYESPRIGGFD